MAASIALNSSSNIDETPIIRGGFVSGLLKRVKPVSEFLRNTKREDLGWMAINMAAGAFFSEAGVTAARLGLSATAGTLVTAAASTAITASTAAVGLTASTAFVATAASLSSIIVVGAASAAVGGVLSGVARTWYNHYCERRKLEHENPRSLKDVLKQESKALFQIKGYKKEILKSTKSALLGAGLMGTFHGASYLLENTEMGREIAGSAKDAFHKAAQHTAGHWSDFKKTLHAKLAFLTSAPAIDGVHKHIPKPMSVASAPVASVPPVTQAIPDSVPKPDVPDVKAPEAPVSHASHENVPKQMKVVPAAEPVAHPGAHLKAHLPDDKIALGPHPGIDDSTREAAFAKVRVLHPLPEAAPADVPAAPDGVHTDLNTVKEAVPAHTLEEQSGSPDKSINPEHIGVAHDGKATIPAEPNLKDEFKTANAAIQAQNAQAAASGLPLEEELAPEKMAGACVANIPDSYTELQAQSNTLPPTNCVGAQGKFNMAAGDYVTVRDGKSGLSRALFSQVAERTSGFMTRVVPSELMDMLRQKVVATGLAP